MIELEKLIRKNVLKLKPYSSARDDFQGTASVYLDANENPYPSEYNRYPDPHQVTLKQKISEIKKVPVSQIFLGNGSDEPIDLLMRAFCEPCVDNVLIPQPTYGMYTVSAEINNVEIKTVKLTPDFDLDVASINKSINAQTKLIFLCSPNNPSGNLLSFEKVKEVITSFKGLVVVDEAYIDFTSQAGFIPLLDQHPNLVVLQTLSKAWGLAAIRLGMCFSNKEIIAVLNKIKPPYNISLLAQQAAEVGLQQEERKNKWVAEILRERNELTYQLATIRSVKKVYPSDANFLLVKIDNAKSVYKKLVEGGIIVRDRSNVILCEDCLRITVGTPAENKALINQLNLL
ncbi:MAG: histidinol-phosphate transaminase [Cyclobacteriaceae bacterium]|nr:histidinol-phosphate transaminase [Cyclobacteriaceae bacterium]